MNIIVMMWYVADDNASMLHLTFLDLSTSAIHVVLYFSSFIQLNIIHSPIVLYKAFHEV